MTTLSTRRGPFIQGDGKRTQFPADKPETVDLIDMIQYYVVLQFPCDWLHREAGEHTSVCKVCLDARHAMINQVDAWAEANGIDWSRAIRFTYRYGEVAVYRGTDEEATYDWLDMDSTFQGTLIEETVHPVDGPPPGWVMHCAGIGERVHAETRKRLDDRKHLVGVAVPGER